MQNESDLLDTDLLPIRTTMQIQDWSELIRIPASKGTDKSKSNRRARAAIQHLARCASVATEGCHEYIRVQDVCLHSTTG